MWPHMSSGPILRWKDTETDLGARRVTASDVEEALRELTIGLAMKVLLANQLSGLWQKVGTIGYESISTPFAWLGLIAFTLISMAILSWQWDLEGCLAYICRKTFIIPIWRVR